MLKTTKIAIRLPKEDSNRIEEIRKKSGIQRSTIIDTAIRFWLKAIEDKKMIRQYEEGYKKKPECLEEIKAMERASAKAFEEDGWK